MINAAYFNLVDIPWGEPTQVNMQGVSCRRRIVSLRYNTLLIDLILVHRLYPQGTCCVFMSWWRVEHATSRPLHRLHAWSFLPHVNFALKRAFEIIGVLVVEVTDILQPLILPFRVFTIDLYARRRLLLRWRFRDRLLGRTVTAWQGVVAEHHGRPQLLFSQWRYRYLISVGTQGFWGLVFAVAVENRYLPHRHPVIIWALLLWVIVNAQVHNRYIHVTLRNLLRFLIRILLFLSYGLLLGSAVGISWFIKHLCVGPAWPTASNFFTPPLPTFFLLHLELIPSGRRCPGSEVFAAKVEMRLIVTKYVTSF